MIGGYGIRAFAISEMLLPVTPREEELISVELPVIPTGSDSIFDFIIDPQGLINATDAIRYGGMSFEEGATLYFKNADGAYDYSRYSDMLTITNRSNVPVKVTITAWIENLGDLQIARDDVFTDDVAELFLAVVDDEGTVLVLDEEGTVSITKELKAAPDNVYVYQYDEAAQSYQYTISENIEEIKFDTYSFGLTGACNPYGDWSTMVFKPVVNLTWSVEPVIVQKSEEIVTVSGNDLNTDNPVRQGEISVSMNDIP